MSPPVSEPLCLDVCHDEPRGGGTRPSVLGFPKAFWMWPPWTGPGQVCLHVSPSMDLLTQPFLSGTLPHSCVCRMWCSQPSPLLRPPGLVLGLGSPGSQQGTLWKVWLKLDIEQWLFCWWWYYLLSLRRNKCCWFNRWETSLVAQMVKCLPAMWETLVLSLGWEDPLEKAMATHSSTLAWRIPWMEEPGRLQSMGSQRVRHDWVTSLHVSGWENLGQPALLVAS